MRIRLLLSFALVVLVSVTGVVLIARRGAATEVRNFMFRGGMTGTDEIVTLLENYYAETGSWNGVEDLLFPGGRGMGRGPGGMSPGMMRQQRLRLADAQGTVLLDSAQTGEAGEQLSVQERQQAIPLRVNSRTIGYLLPEGGVAFSAGDESQLLNRITRAAIIAGLIAGAFALLLALLLAYRLLRPVQAMTRATVQMAQGDLSQRVPVQGNDELALLGRSFNHMADSLEQAQLSRRALTADIAHELRNPLAVQRANLEALQDGIYPLTPDSLQPVLDQNLLLTRLVEDLRTLALAEGGQMQLERQPTDLPALAQRVVERFQPQAHQQQVQLTFTATAQPALQQIPIDAARVTQVLSNLISNALRYTPPGGSIRVSIARSKDEAMLQVHDSGSGIPQEALPHIFERFYRADKSRSRQEGGTGLGLAIARQLAELHGGSLQAANHPQGGALFTLHLPLIQ